MHGRLQREHVQGYVCAAHAHAHQAGQELDAFLARHRERDYTRVVYVGDGANDIDLLEAAGCGVALCAKPILREHADVVVDVPSFTPLRWLLGL